MIIVSKIIVLLLFAAVQVAQANILRSPGVT